MGNGLELSNVILLSKGNIEIQVFWQMTEEMIKFKGNEPIQGVFLVFRVKVILSVNLHNISTEHGDTTIEKENQSGT